MQKIRFFIIFLLLLFPLSISAKEQARVLLGEPADLFLAGSDIRISEPAPRDLVVGGGVVVIGAEVGEDVLVAGGTVTVQGDVVGDVRGAGGTIRITGAVGGNVSVAGGEVIIADSASVAGSVLLIGADAVIEGDVSGDVRVYAKRIILNGAIEGETAIHTPRGTDIAVGASASFGGPVAYTSSSRSQALEGISEAAVSYKQGFDRREISRSVKYLFSIISLFGMLVVGLLVVTVWPTTIRESARTAMENPLRSMVWGLGALILIPLLSMVLLFTIIGIPIAAIMLIGYVIAVYLSQILIGIVLGTYVFDAIAGRTKKIPSSLLAIMVAGIAIYWLITGLPVIGPIIGIIGVIWGMGVVVQLKLRAHDMLEGSKK